MPQNSGVRPEARKPGVLGGPKIQCPAASVQKERVGAGIHTWAQAKLGN